MKSIKSIIIISMFLLFVSLIFTSGCLTQNESHSTNTGKSNAQDTTKISLDTALNSLYNQTGGSPQIYYMKGSYLDPQASAAEWIFGVKTQNSSYFFIYNEDGGVLVDWPGDFSSGLIKFQEGNVKPAELFESNKDFIREITSSGSIKIDTLELVNGRYNLLIENKSQTQQYLFNESTGKRIF